MKYVVIFVVVVILVRIDVILKLFDKQAVKYQTTTSDVSNTDIEPGSDLVPIANDLSLQTSPYKTFLTMLNDFRTTADINVKNKAIEILRANPVMVSDKINPEFETAIFRMRDLLIQRDKVTHEFLIEIMKSLKGENLEMVRRFFSYTIDIDLPEFMALYSKTSDVNCMIMGYLGDNLSDDEKYNELSERSAVLDAFLLTEKALPYKFYGSRCQLVLKVQIDKLKAVVGPGENSETPPEAEEGTSVTTVAPSQPTAPTPTPTTIPVAEPADIPLPPITISAPGSTPMSTP